MKANIWTDSNGAPKVLRGIAVMCGSTRIAEMAGRAGYDVVWIDVEHGSTPAAHVEAMCVAVENGGAISLVRAPDTQRRHILWALEWGATIVVSPMVDDAQAAESMVKHGKFGPLGRRGYNTRSRGVGYGFGSMPDLFDSANKGTYLFAQIETREAVANIAQITAVDGLSGIFIGPGDLSCAYGCVSDMTNPDLIDAVCMCISHAKKQGKHAGILVSGGPMLTAAEKAGADLIIEGTDLNDLADVWQSRLRGAGS